MKHYIITCNVYCRELYPVVLQTVELSHLYTLAEGFLNLSCCHIDGKNDRVPSLLVVGSILGECTVQQHLGSSV